jgi:hypothetical protein
MVDKLAASVPAFGGTASHTRCFLHTVNLVAKSLIREFYVMKKNADKALDAAMATNDNDDSIQVELDELSEEIDREDAEMIAEDDELKDNDDGWVNEMEELADDERFALEASILPVKLALVKVSKKKHIPSS